jgi:peroxiredoxin
MKQKVEIMHFITRTFLANTLVILLLVFGCTSKAEKNELASGRAPDFALKNLEGNTLRLENLRGKVVLLNFFTTWCGPCRQEIPDFVRLYKKYKDQGLEIVGISLDMEGASLLIPFARQYGINYPIVLGTRNVVEDYGGVTGIPTSFFIDRNGNVAGHFIGVLAARVLEKTVLELLSKKG